MPVEIDIRYPEQPRASEQEIETLKRYHDILRKKLIELTVRSHEHYEWAIDPSRTTGRYFGLRPVGGDFLFVCNIKELSDLSPEDFFDRLMSEKAIKDAREESYRRGHE